jgi:hypothetical protein
MNYRKLSGKLKFSLTLIGSTIVIAGIIDLVILGNFYHPLSSAYQTVNWLTCRQGLVVNCDPDQEDNFVTGKKQCSCDNSSSAY